MKKKELYIFNEISRAAVYGIGSYVDQLIKALKDTEWKINIVNLYVQGNEIEIIEKDKYRQINIPFPSNNHYNAKQYYPMVITSLLKDIIPDDKKVEYIFHMNFMSNNNLVKCLKKHFRCKVILVTHYSDWSFSLLGNVHKLKNLLQKPMKALADISGEKIVAGFNEDIKMINSVDYWVCVARHTLETYYKISKICVKKATIIHNALEDIHTPLSNSEKLQLREKYYLKENVKIILFAGRLDEIKGITYLIQAFKMVLATNPDTRLFIAGDGNFNLLLKESADCWTKIYFTGLINKKQLNEFYNIADLGIVCSLYEEFGLVAIEMMMHALPIIVSQTGGLDEIVEDGISGLKVPIRTIKGKRQVDIKRLAENIQFLLNNPVDAQKLGENGRKRFLDKFELSIFKEKMMELYESLCNQ